MTRTDLPHIVEESLRRLSGRAPVARVAQDIWERYEAELRVSGDLFFTWQYDIRWAAQRLRDAHKLSYTREGGGRVWELIE